MSKLKYFKYLVPVAFSVACSGAETGALSESEPDPVAVEDTSKPADPGPPGTGGPASGDSSPDAVSCSLEYSQLKEQRFALDAETPLGVGAEIIAPWTLSGSTELSKFDTTTSQHVPAGGVTFDLEPREVLYATGTAPHDVCKPYEVLSIWAHLKIDLDGAVYESDGRVEVKPAGTLSGSDQVLPASGELALLELSCTSGCADGDKLLFTANLDDTGRTLGFITRGSDELSFKVP